MGWFKDLIKKINDLFTKEEEIKQITDGTERTTEEDARKKFINELNGTNSTDEILDLKTSDAVLNYVKQMYVDEYNKSHEKQISVEDVSFNKSSFDKVFYKDMAENGEEILRYCSEKEAKERGLRIDGNNPVITATIRNEGGAISEKVAQTDSGKIVNIYSQDEVVKENKNTTLTGLGNVVLTGINRATSMDQEETSWQTKDQYRLKFTKAVEEYKQGKQYYQEQPRQESNQEVSTDGGR